MSTSMVYGVLSACGGAGGSAFAAMLAGRAVALGRGPVVLIDTDRLGGGIDVLLGCERVPGPRWGQVRLAGGTFDPADLLRSLPRWSGVSVLAADSGTALDPRAIEAVLSALTGVATVVVDVPRWPDDIRATALAACRRLVLVTPAEVRAVAAGAVLLEAAGGQADWRDRCRVAVRGAGAVLSAAQVADALELPLIGPIPYEPAIVDPDGLSVVRLRRATRRVVDATLRPDLMPVTAEPAA